MLVNINSVPGPHAWDVWDAWRNQNSIQGARGAAPALTHLGLTWGGLGAATSAQPPPSKLGRMAWASPPAARKQRGARFLGIATLLLAARPEDGCHKHGHRAPCCIVGASWCPVHSAPCKALLRRGARRLLGAVASSDLQGLLACFFAREEFRG